MPFKPIASKDDYPERDNPRCPWDEWGPQEQERNLRAAVEMPTARGQGSGIRGQTPDSRLQTPGPKGGVMKIGDMFAYIVLGVTVVACVFLCGEQDTTNSALVELVRAEVKAEMDRRYRNVPRIQVEKVYTLHATGQDVVLDIEK